MRKIKFRGYHTHQKKMYSAEEMAADQLTLLPTGQFINVSGNDTRHSTIYPADKFIPLQFTGLLDKKGTEIYEGDIVKSGNGRIWEIKHGTYKMHHPGTIFELYGWYGEGCGTQVSLYDGLEVIGNIYEHGDLIRVIKPTGR